MIVSLQSWASHYCLALLLLITCRYSNTQQTFYLRMCVCMHIVCATASSVYKGFFHAWKCISFALYYQSMWISVCVFYYVLVGRLGIITQAWLSTYNVVWMTEREIQRTRDRNVWDSLVWSRSSALCWCMMGIGFHLLFSVTICYVVIQWKFFWLEIQNLLFTWR